MSEDFVCVCHLGREQTTENNDFVCCGELTVAIVVNSNVTYNEFLLIFSRDFSVEIHENTIQYTTKFPRRELVQLNEDNVIVAMCRLNE